MGFKSGFKGLNKYTVLLYNTMPQGLRIFCVIITDAGWCCILPSGPSEYSDVTAART